MLLDFLHFTLRIISLRIKKPGSNLLSPFVSTLAICTDIIQPHVLLCSSWLSLEEDSLPVTTSWAGMFSRFRKSWVVNDFRYNSWQLIHVVSDFVDIDTEVRRRFFVLTVTTGILKTAVVSILLRVQHVITFLTELDSNEDGSVMTRNLFRFWHLCNSVITALENRTDS